MREIKFRGKRIDNGEWVTGFYFESFTGIPYIMVLYDHILGMTKCYEVDPKTVGQYTLKKDKKDNKIFSGDIMEGGYFNPLTGLFVSRKFIIVYKDACFIGKLIGHSPYGDTWLNHIDGEIIGNIHDNPELLKEQEG